MTRQSTEDVMIPAELVETLRRAATGVPGGPPELTEIRRRQRHRQMRRSAAALAGVGVLVAASIVTPRLLTGSATPVESAAPAVTAEPTPPPPPAQRLLLSELGFTVALPAGVDSAVLPDRLDPSLPNFGFPPGAVGIATLGHQEVTPSGEVVPVDVPGEDHRGYLPLRGGRFVTLEWQSLSDVPRRDGPCITDAALYLRVYESDGTMSLSRDVRVQCENTTLVSASDTEVFLVRTPHDEQNQMPTSGRRLVAHNLADGGERPIVDLDGISPDIRDLSLAVNIDAGRIVAVPETAGCQVETVDIASGAVSALDLAATVGGCYHVDRLRLSPDGERLAVAYTTNDNGQPYDVMLAVVDLAGPELRLRELVDSSPAFDPQSRQVSISHGAGGPRLTFRETFAAGLAWSDGATVRVAWVRVPPGLDRLIAIDEVLDVQTYAVP